MRQLYLLIAAVALLHAQVNPYPGGYPGSYPGQYPTGSGIPIPTRGKQGTSKGSDSKQATPTFEGTLKRLDEKIIIVDLDDYRSLEFRRSGKTKFFVDGKEVAKPEFNRGDRVTIEATQDVEGYLTAVNVRLQKKVTAGEAPDESAKSATDSTGDQMPSATQMARTASESDRGDPDAPKLKRGKPTRQASSESTEPAGIQPVASQTAPAPAAIESRPDSPDEDPLIAKARETAFDFTGTLPSYICQQMITRYQSDTSPASWRPLDVVSAEVVYEDGKEDYRNLKISGKPVKGKMEDLPGSWSTGEFGTFLVDLFSRSTAADFHFRRESQSSGIPTKVYGFDVERENSHWTVHVGPQTYEPAYRGSIWIDPKTSRVLRIEVEARGLPEGFPLDKLESAIDYDYIRLVNTTQYLLPVHAEMLSCHRGSSVCSRNVIDFRNYHKFAGASSVSFDDVK
ncbi:MAG: hypothetical protein ABFD60_03740 [Bryobacteraceae bacterium]